jgi:hypothetical protein
LALPCQKAVFFAEKQLSGKSMIERDKEEKTSS